MTDPDPAIADMVPRMPFGKHQGLPLRQLPAAYLAWLRTRDNLFPGLRLQLEEEVAFRTQQALEERRMLAKLQVLNSLPAAQRALGRQILDSYTQVLGDRKIDL